MNSGLTEQGRQAMNERGLIHQGNLAPILRVMRNAQEGKSITIGFIGGSITAGSLAGREENCYAYRVYQWWKDRFPQCRVNYINAGVGATSSQFAVARVDEDLLQCQPDFVVAEFSVNDKDNEFYQETFEGLIRRILLHPSKPALFLFHNVFYDDGHNAQRVHNEVGIYYDLPIVSMKESIYEEVKRGTLRREEITPDGLHPNDYGHELVAGVILHRLEYIYQKIDEYLDSACPYIIPGSPLTPNRFFASVRLSNTNTTPNMYGFLTDQSAKAGNWDVFRGGWYGYRRGDRICFQVTASLISIQYRKYAEHPAPVAVAVLNGDEKNASILDANFEETWGDCLFLQDIKSPGKKENHSLEIRITEEAGEKPFYLAAVIIA